ncbi:cadherin-like domain-containing protein, partial [Novosphingobium sp. 9U]|uniref:cadherin-like domain-containing protein n=1 Tax=Novosphingobium sp. 9U TaxID=2653158 RepID=UPI0019158BE9
MTLINKMVGNEIFLQGKYLSVGVNSSGNIGSRYSAPEGVDHDLTYKRVGLLADTDGFGTGKAAMRDAVVRGAPIEGFNIGYKTDGKTYVHSNQELAGLTEIAGKSSNGSAAGVAEANWKGATTEKLGVDQTITLTEDAKYVRFEVTLTNNSSEAMSDVRYLRAIDPDLVEGYSTVNKIVRQGDGGALVTAGASATSDPIFLYTSDTRAVATTYGFINEDPYDAGVSVAQKVGTVTKTDVTMNLNFKLGTLGAGESTTVVFYMGGTDNLNATIEEIDALAAGGQPTATRPSLNVAPEVYEDALTIVSGETGKGNVLANDTDANKDALTAALKSGPANGTVTLAADGNYVYKAAEGFSGTDSFTYTATDGKASSTATVSVTVSPKAVQNTAPEAKSDALTIVSGETGNGNVLANDTDANKDALTAAL